MYQCSICLEQYNNESDLASTKCGHIFHEACITDWCRNEEARPCPICRGECAPTQKIYLEPDPEYENKLAAKDEVITQLGDNLDGLRILAISAETIEEQAVNRQTALEFDLDILRKENEELKNDLETQKQVLEIAQNELVDKDKQIEGYKKVIDDILTANKDPDELSSIKSLLEQLVTTNSISNVAPKTEKIQNRKCIVKNVRFEDITTSVTNFIIYLGTMTGLAITRDDIEDAGIREGDEDTFDLVIEFKTANKMKTFLHHNFSKFPEFENIEVHYVNN